MDSSPQIERMVTALAEQLKTPLVQIAQLSEAHTLEQSGPEMIAALSRQALQSIDALVFAQQQVAFELEPVSIGAVLYDVAHDMSVATRGQDVHIEINQHGRDVPVMAHAAGLRTVLRMASDVLLQLQNTTETSQSRHLVLGNRRAGDKLMVGSFGANDALTPSALALSRKLYGRAAQVAPVAGLAGGASLAIADKLATQLQSALAVYRYNSVRGLGLRLVPSKQLRLVA